MGGEVVVTDRFVLFWDGWPSQWHWSEFELDGVRYNCCEQFMMAEKARVFGDAGALRDILATQSPREQKAIGRRVRGFDTKIWEGVCRGVVYRGNLAKFEQDAELARVLLETGDRTIVEASPTDRIWGIGLGAKDPKALDPAQWRGKNWLGVAVMQVRDELRRTRGMSAPTFAPELKEQLERRARLP